MTTLLTIVLSILLIAEFVLGIFFNCFIVLVNCIDWIKRHKISLMDQILLALALSRIGLLWVIVLNWIGAMFYEDSYVEVYYIFDIAWVISNHFSIWLATSLSIFFLLKIVSFSSPLFCYLKRSIKKILLTITLGSLTFLAFQLASANRDHYVWTNGYKENSTWDTKWKEVVALSNLTAFTTGNLIPFTMSLMSFVLLLFSLYKHIKKMQMNGTGSQDLNTMVHIRVMQTVISFLLLYACYFVAVIICLWSIDKEQNKAVFQVCEIILTLYPSSHSFILIWGNKKLKQAFESFFCQLKFERRERK